MNSEDRIIIALKRVVRPLVRLLISRGIRLPSVVAALKQVYVDVAESDFRLDDKVPTDSRVSVLTGVHRRDVGNIRRDGKPSSMPSSLSLGATVVGRWLGSPTYIDPEGQAKALHRSADQGAPNFEDLANACSKDVHPRTILDDLIDQNLVEWDEEEDVVVLSRNAYLPTGDSEDLMSFFEMNLHDHLAAAVDNVISAEKPDPFLERAVYYNMLSPQSIEEINSLARQRADEILNELNREGLRHQDADRERGGATKRFRFGVFLYNEDGEGQPSDND